MYIEKAKNFFAGIFKIQEGLMMKEVKKEAYASPVVSVSILNGNDAVTTSGRLAWNSSWGDLEDSYDDVFGRGEQK